MNTVTTLKSHLESNIIEAGCDEAGRGCLAGPVFAAAVVLPPNFKCEGLNDSKKLTAKKRNELRLIIEREAISFHVGICSPKEIDELNILWASVAAMHKALSGLLVTPDHILVDGNRFRPFHDIPHTCVVGGDAKFLSIAAASILAKTYRDDYMTKIHQDYPHYEWDKNKGYPTKAHRNAIAEHGVTVYHRKSFSLIDKQSSISFK